MFPYWLMFSLFAVGAVQYPADFRRSLQGRIFLLVGALFTAAFVGLRYEVGGDWLNYIDILQDIGYRDFFEGMWKQDPGYGIINWVISRAGLEIWAVNLVCALIFSWGLYKFSLNQPNPWLVFVVAAPYLIIVVAMGYTRQGVAIGFILAGIAQLDRGMLRFMFYMVLSASFHKSGVVVLPLVVLAAQYRRIVTAGIGIISAVLLYYLFVQASIDRLMTNYVDAGYSSQGASIRVAMNIPPAILFLIFKKRFILNEQEGNLWRNFSIAALVALAALYFTDATTAVDRLALYIIPLQMFVLSRLPSAFPGRQGSSIALTLFVIAYSAAIQFVWLNYADNSDSWLPYRWYPLVAREY